MPFDVILATRLEGGEAAPVAAVARRLARAVDVPVTLLYVAVELDTLPRLTGEGGLDEESARREILIELEARAEGFLAEHIPGQATRIVIAHGDVARRIASVAADRSAELVVVGGGHTGVLDLLRGDTVQDLLERAPCPVVVVPRD